MSGKVDLSKTFVDTMYINKFRAFEKQKIDIGRNLTMICGINGTGKSTILGILAQICSFSSNYIPSNNEAGFEKEEFKGNKKFKTIYEIPFESNFKSHFRISKKFDLPDSDNENYLVDFSINDAEEQTNFNAELRGTRRQPTQNQPNELLRLVFRKETTITTNKSRNITFPTIFLSLGRLVPFVQRQEKMKSAELNDSEKDFFLKTSDSIFTPVRPHRNLSTNFDDNGHVNSTVNTDDNYDIESASTGEDNLGQIISALISFQRLKKSWAGYKGGLLLIDELDASIFPHSQTNLLKTLNKFAAKNDIQIVFTTHSPIMIQQMLLLQKKSRKTKSTAKNIGINFISNSTGKPVNATNLNLDQMVAKLNIVPLNNAQPNKLHCYCEDDEAYCFLQQILPWQQRKKLKLMKTITIGGDNLINLMKIKISEFSSESVVILDGDKKIPFRSQNAINLPSPTPPDQLMFHILDDCDAEKPYWQENENWNRQIFVNSDEYHEITSLTRFDTTKNCYLLNDKNSGVKVRELFKKWYKKNKRVLNLKATSPIGQLWKPVHLTECNKFQEQFDSSYSFAFQKANYLS